MKWNEKYYFLYDLYENPNDTIIKNNFEMIKTLANDYSPLIRGMVAKICSVYNSSAALQLLISMSSDKNNLVRVDVADSLSSFEDEHAYKRLIFMCEDSYYMVRGYAEYGVGLIGASENRKENSIRIINRKLQVERFNFNKLQCYMALYFLGYSESIQSMLSIYPTLRYQDKCVVLNFLIDILSSKEDIEQVLTYLNEKENSNIKCIAELISQLSKSVEHKEDRGQKT